MLKKYITQKNTYADSITLMRLSSEIESAPGIFQATAVMSTPANLEVAVAAELIDKEFQARPTDLLVAVCAENEQAADDALKMARDRLNKSRSASAVAAESQNRHPKSLQMGVTEQNDLNFALISCPGEFAAAEAEKALNLGLHTMIFSDNVSFADERRLKQIALEKDLFMMGPDCGSTILSGVPLGFANVVNKGNIGLVAASGTGLQQVTCLISQGGSGISHALGTGGRDLSPEIGGISMIQGIKALAADKMTEIIVIISKPPSEDVARKVIETAENTGKPVIVCFLGSGKHSGDGNLHFAASLADAAELALKMSKAGYETPAADNKSGADLSPIRPGQKYIRGVYSGGTFCYEAQIILRESLGNVWSPTPLDNESKLASSDLSREHTVIDLGDDEFTRGRPHPMIDHRTRHERILQEAGDPTTALILFDLVLGYGAHPNPAAEMCTSIRNAREIAGRDNRDIIFVGFVCGTDQDPQNLRGQIQMLEQVNVIVEDHNAAATRRAVSIVQALQDARVGAPNGED